MQETLGTRIARLRKTRAMTQESLAEKLNVSPQAVSKWENDQSCPDVLLLPLLADLLGVTADALLRGEREPAVRLIPPENRKRMEEMMLRIYVYNNGAEEVRVSTPLMLCKIMLESGLQPDFILSGSDRGAQAMQNIRLEELFALVEKGMIGTLMEVNTRDGTQVRIVVE